MVEEDNLKVIFYTSNNCAPCAMMKQKLIKIREQMPLKLTTINISTSSHAPDDIRVTPVIKIAKNSEKIVGNVDLDDLRNILMRNLFTNV
ncbi:MAG: glutaredoxin family protein [Promethearchaeota archaeon]